MVKRYLLAAVCLLLLLLQPSLQQDNTEVCHLPKQQGLCMAYFRRFYYDVDTQQCHFFIYGGCGGNANNFKSLEACVAACQPPPTVLP